MNFKISPRRYHWGTRQKVRERKIDRISAGFTEEMRLNLRNYERVPSPRGELWMLYIELQMHLLPIGIATFGTRKYARLLLDKYIESNRESDETAKLITENRPSLIMLGGAELHPSRPIGIKRRKRCPGTRKLVVSIKKLHHSRVIFVDEYFTSQTCPNCFGRFAQNTRKNRIKICKKCKPTNPHIGEAQLPNKIVTQLGKKALEVARFLWRMDIDKYPSVRMVEHGARRVSKVVTYRKNWQPAPNGQLKGKTVVWHRDIAAARCILYKGKHSIIHSCDIVLNWKRS